MGLLKISFHISKTQILLKLMFNGFYVYCFQCFGPFNIRKKRAAQVPNSIWQTVLFYIKSMPSQLFMALYTTVADLDPLQLQIRWIKNLNSSGIESFLKRFLLLIQATYYVLLPD